MCRTCGQSDTVRKKVFFLLRCKLFVVIVMCGVLKRNKKKNGKMSPENLE